MRNLSNYEYVMKNLALYREVCSNSIGYFKDIFEDFLSESLYCYCFQLPLC